MRVLVLGASRYYARSIARLRDEGFGTIAVDKDPTAPGLTCADDFAVCDIVNVQGVTEVALKYKPDVVLPLNDFGVPTAALVSRNLGLPSISVDAADAATNKEKMRRIWSSHGLPCPHYRVERDRDRIRRAVREIGLPVILKPAHGIGGGSRGVVVVREMRDLDEAIEVSQSYYEDKATIVEQFIPGISEHSAEFVVVDGEPRLITVGDKQKTPLPYRVDKSVIYPSSLPASAMEQIQSIGSKSITSLGIDRGTAHLEFSWNGESLTLFELGARCGGGATPEPIVRYLTGIDLIVEQVKSLAGLSPIVASAAEDRACVYRFLTPEPGVVTSVSGWHEIMNDSRVLDAHLGLEVGAHIRPVRTGIDRVGFLVVGGKLRNETLALTDQLESRLRVSYED